MRESVLPTGWDEARIQRVLIHYENQSEEEAVEEDESVLDDPSQILMKIPVELVPQVRELLARYAVSKRAA